MSPRTAHWPNSIAIGGAIILGIISLLLAALDPLTHLGVIISGPFWNLPVWAWMAVAALAALSLFHSLPVVRAVAIVSFGLATMGALGYLEPFGVFHDSWPNVGLGRLALEPTQTGAARQVQYVASSPNGFLLFGLLSHAFPDTPSFLRVYPLFCVLVYSAGLHVLAMAFIDAHPAPVRVDRSRFGQMSVFAFLAMAPNFLVRVNPAPQSLAFALMPFCLAALINGSTNWRFGVVALFVFVIIVFTHAITSAMIISLGIIWWGLDQLLYRHSPQHTFFTHNTAILYACVFLSWLIYVGVWLLRSGVRFASRVIEVLNAGQHATITAAATGQPQAFIWLHRVALGGSALLVLSGVGLMLYVNRKAGTRLIAWLGVSAVLLPFLFFGEFGDRGPLFASLPGALAVGFVLSWDSKQLIRRVINSLVLIVTVTTYITAYPTHVGEVITESEVYAFHVVVNQSTDQELIIYGYAPPLSGDELPVYGQDRIRTFALGAADFSYEQLVSIPGIVVVSDQMRAAAATRGPHALAQFEDFKTQLLVDPRYELILDNGSVIAFRAHQP